MEVYAYANNETNGEPTCNEDDGVLFFERPAQCAMYSSMGKFGVSEYGPLFQTNHCLKTKGKPKKKWNKSFLEKIYSSIAHLFKELGAGLGLE